MTEGEGFRQPTVFVVTKTAMLGEQIQRILSVEGQVCETIQVDETFNKAAFLEKLLGSPARLIFAQDRMSPYSATELLLDLSHWGVVHEYSVVCLAQIYTWKQRGAFELLGGLHCIELDPGESRETREEKIRYALLVKVAKHRSYQESKVEHREKIACFLEGLNEEGDLRAFAVRLFRNLGYDDVLLTHGPLEVGKDLVFSELNKLGIREFVGVQIKLGDVHASVSSKGNVTALWLQSVEALNSRVSISGNESLLDKYVVMVSGTIRPAAELKLREFLRNTGNQRRVFFLGKEKIADLVVNHCSAMRDDLAAGIG